MAAGSTAMHDATVHNVENFFGWTMPAAEFIQSVRSESQTPVRIR
jgi:hypothetical protein